jgi:dTDP-4-amino-4,6-dideoxygalactose transaminase
VILSFFVSLELKINLVGVEVLDKKIGLSTPHMSDEGYELYYVNKAFEDNWIAPIGENVDEFEKSIAEYVKSDFAVALSSGTSAIHLALKALGVGSGDVVFCSSLTFAASANPILYENATPVFIDSEYGSWNMCPFALERAYKMFPNPKAVIVVNLYGQSADYESIRQVTSKYGTPIIEDAAESLGATYKGQQTGTLGDIGIFSFNGNKIITTSGGGMLVCNNFDVAKKAKFWATQARDIAPWYQHSDIGYNYRMSNISAGIGRGQIKVLNNRIEKKKYIYEFYKMNFYDNQEIEMMPICNYGESNYWLSCMILNKSSNINPMDIIEALASQNIESRPIWKPMHLQPIFSNKPFVSIEENSTSVSEDIFNRGICLPSDTKMRKEEIEKVIEVVKGFFDRGVR